MTFILAVVITIVLIVVIEMKPKKNKNTAAKVSKAEYTAQTRYGNLRSDKPPKGYEIFWLGCSVFWGLIFIFSISLVFFYIADKDFGWAVATCVMSAIPALATWGSLFCRKRLLQEYDIFMEEVREAQKEKEAAQKKYQQEHPFPKAEAFFKKARAAGISNLKTQADLSRLALFAKNNGLTAPMEKIVEDFKLGKQYVEYHEKKGRLDAVRQEENELLKEYTRYSEYMDQEKSVAYCTDKIEEYRILIAQYEEAENSASSTGSALYRAGKQQESSWAIHGGIASGIAGGAAGLAVAADVERRNQEKRQHNAELASATAALTAMQLTKIWERKRSAKSSMEYWNERLEAAKLTLSEQQNEYELLDMLHPAVKEHKISESGAIHITVDLMKADTLTIYGTIKAVVDGSIKVLVKAGNEVVGEAVAVLPYGGVKTNVSVNAICCGPAKHAQEYTFAFAPNYLWAVEVK